MRLAESTPSPKVATQLDTDDKGTSVEAKKKKQISTLPM